MKTNVKLSKNQKLNFVLNDIYFSLLSMRDTEKESIQEIKRYKDDFPKELDFNLYQHGNLLIYNDQIKSLYSQYKSLQKVSIDKLIEIYKRQVRYVANYILANI